MTDVNANEPSAWVGRTAVDRSGDKVGKIVDMYVDDDTGQPEWLAVSTGLLGKRVSFVPLHGASAEGDDVVIAWDKATVKDDPNAEPDSDLSPEEEQRLYEYYGMGDAWTAGRGQTANVETGRRSDERLADYSERGTTDDAMTRAEEEVSVAKQSREAGRARLRKWVETETTSE